jgi:hypothetical protein
MFLTLSCTKQNKIQFMGGSIKNGTTVLWNQLGKFGQCWSEMLCLSQSQCNMAEFETQLFHYAGHGLVDYLLCSS